MTKQTSMANYKRAFKDADIRGIYPSEIDEEVAYLIARAFVDEFAYTQMVVGYDMRVSTPCLRDAFIAGARDAGAGVIDVGLVSSPMLYFASGSLNLPGAMITASHSPKDFNGIKLVAPGAVPLTKTTGLSAVKKRIDRGVFKEPKKIGTLKQKDIRPGYQRYVLKQVKAKSWPKMKVAVDVGNGMSAVVMPLLEEKLPISFKLLYPKLDGTFPNRDSDPCLAKNQKGLKEVLKKHKFDFGVGFDGDADRIAFHDERGRYVNCAAIGALVATRLLRQHPGSGIVYTNLTSRSFEETIKAHGGKAIRARVGHAFLKRKMRDTGAVFGAEHSGHFFFKDFFTTDSVSLTLLHVLAAYSEAKQNGMTFSELLTPYLQYAQTEDVIVPVKDKTKVLKKMEQKLKSMHPQKLTKFDGYFVDFGDVWGSVKPSVTEFAIKLMFESKTKTKAQAVQKELLAELQRIARA